MEVEKFSIEGVLLLTPRVFEDDRGYFYESFNQNQFDEIVGKPIKFCQDNQSFSKKDVLRGMHFQTPPFAQGKLVRVIQGSVLDVAVDLRADSPTYGQHVKVHLSAQNKKQFWIPEGFAHGFLTLEEGTVFNYKCTNFYHKESESSLNWNDPDLNIDWEINGEPLLSEKDSVPTTFKNYKSPF